MSRYDIVYVPLEDLQMRYTSHLNQQVGLYLAEHKKNPISIKPRSVFETGLDPSNFLDPGFTLQYKAAQTQILMKLITENRLTNNAIIFFADLWHPAVISLGYLRAQTKFDFVVRGFLHAGSWTPSDDVAMKMQRWARGFESAIVDIADDIFVATTFHYQELIRSIPVQRDKLQVTQLQLDHMGMAEAERRPWHDRENIVVFNGRHHPEKQPELFEWLRKELCNEGLEIMFVDTHQKQYSKLNYYNLLGRAKVCVSFALQENFGYGLAEALWMGCVPVVPDRLAYKELYNGCRRYSDPAELIEMVKKALYSDRDPIDIRERDKFAYNTNTYMKWFRKV